MYYLLLSVLIGLSYVVAIYIYPPLAVVGKDRNNENVILHRLYRISWLCVSLFILVPLLTPIKYTDLGLLPGLSSSSTFCTDVSNIFVCCKLMLIMYTCKIIDYICNYKLGNILDDLYINFLTLTGFRDHLFAPITEEFIYRAIIVNLLLLENYSSTFIIILAPLLFGFAHLHHGYQSLRQNSVPVAAVIVQIVFMTLYTSLFGMLETHFYLKYNHNFLAVVIVHLVCNLFGFPNLFIDGSPAYKLLYYGSMCFGIIGFFYML